jgi:phosphate-selective porin OprO/OprP
MQTLVSSLVSLLVVAGLAEVANAQEPAPPQLPSESPAVGSSTPTIPDAPSAPSKPTPTPVSTDGGALSISAVSSTGLFNPPRATPTAAGGPGDPASVAAGPGGFRIESLDKRSEIRLRALVQADGRFWFDDTQRPQTDTFLIRRAYSWVEGRLPYGVNFMLNPDFGGGTVVLQDAYLGIDLDDAVKFRFGKFKSPFGLERLQPTSNLSFVEFGLPSLLAPNRDVGAMVYGDVFNRFAGYAAGVFNGVPDNGSADIDIDREKEFAGRVYLRPFSPIPDQALGRLFVGVATTFGRVYGTPNNPAFSSPSATPAYKTPGQSTDFSYIAAATGVTPDYSNTVVANGPHNRYGVYLYEALGPLGLMGEYYESDQEVGRAGKGNAWIHNKAYQAQATFVFFGADASYDFVHVRTPFEPLQGHFGALEGAFRAGHLANDTAAFPNYASPTASVRGATEFTTGLNWYWSDNAKFVVNWDHTEFQGGAKTPDEILAGHREAENIWLLRAQIVY